jgi:hypothetical protein
MLGIYIIKIYLLFHITCYESQIKKCVYDMKCESIKHSLHVLS